MKTTFTPAEALARRGCYSREQAQPIIENKTSITTSYIIDHPRMLLTEKCWFLANQTELTPDELRSLAQSFAEASVKIYEDTSPHPYESPRQSILDPTQIVYAQKLANYQSSPQAYAIYACTTRNPHDRIFSAAKAAELAGHPYDAKIIDILKEFFT